MGHILSRFLFSHSRPVPATASHLAQVLNPPLPGNPSTSCLLLNHVVAKLWIESGQSENSKHCLLEPGHSTPGILTHFCPCWESGLPSLVSNESISSSEICGHHGHWAQDWAQSLSWGSRFNETLTGSPVVSGKLGLGAHDPTLRENGFPAFSAENQGTNNNSLTPFGCVVW